MKKSKAFRLYYSIKNGLEEYPKNIRLFGKDEKNVVEQLKRLVKCDPGETLHIAKVEEV